MWGQTWKSLQKKGGGEAEVKSKHKVSIENILPNSCQTFACIDNVVLIHPHCSSRHLQSCKQKSAVSLCHIDYPHVFPQQHQVRWHPLSSFLNPLVMPIQRRRCKSERRHTWHAHDSVQSESGVGSGVGVGVIRKPV